MGVDKIKMRGKLRVTLPLFDELPCVAGIQVSIAVRTSLLRCLLLLAGHCGSPPPAQTLVCLCKLCLVCMRRLPLWKCPDSTSTSMFTAETVRFLIQMLDCLSHLASFASTHKPTLLDAIMGAKCTSRLAAHPSFLPYVLAVLSECAPRRKHCVCAPLYELYCGRSHIPAWHRAVAAACGARECLQARRTCQHWQQHPAENCLL